MSTLPDDTTLSVQGRRRVRPSAGQALLVLTSLGLVLGLSGIVGTTVLHRPEPVWTGAVSTGLLLILSAVALALIVFGHAALVALKGLRNDNASIQQQVSVLAERAVARSQAPAPPPPGLTANEMRGLLLDIRETLLLPEPERKRRFERLVERELQRGLTNAERHILSRDFHRAREELGTLAERFGQDERMRTAHERLERAAEAARANDFTQAMHRVDDLISMARWDEAERVAREVLDKYPVSQEVNALLIRVQRERKVYEQRYRQRLFEEVQQSVSQRRWQEAAASAHKFLENFPVGADSDALRAQIELLVANADIQARQGLEQQLKELVRQHQYWDALALARRIISEHPLSPQANALRGQLARLEELARQSAAPSA